MIRRTPEARFYSGAAEGFAIPTLHLWTVVYPTGTVRVRGILRHPFSHKRRGRAVTIPPRYLNPFSERPTARRRQAATTVGGV